MYGYQCKMHLKLSSINLMTLDFYPITVGLGVEPRYRERFCRS